jgi:hypothetical protein
LRFEEGRMKKEAGRVKYEAGRVKQEVRRILFFQLPTSNFRFHKHYIT